MVIGIDASRAFDVKRTGTENYAYSLITHIIRLPAAKKHTFVLFVRPNVILPNEITQAANIVVKTISLPVLWTQIGLALATWGKFSNLKFSPNPNVMRVQANSQMDVLWIPAHTLPLLRNPRVKTLVTIHGLEYRYLPEYNNLLQRWYLPLSTFYAAKAADKLICVSESTKRDLISEISFDIEKATVIYEGVEIEQRNKNIEYREKLYSMFNIQTSKYILFVGTIQPRKNLGALIAAFAQFYSRHSEYKLVIAGGVGWMAEVDLKLPDELGIPDRVVFTGRVDDLVLSVLYQGAAVYVQPSWTEGFGLPVLEAMANSVPVVVSDGGALPEIVGNAGVIVEFDKNKKQEYGISKTHQNVFVERLAGAMERVVNDAQLQKRLIAAGKKRVKELSWKKAAEETLSLITTGLYSKE